MKSGSKTPRVLVAVCLILTILSAVFFCAFSAYAMEKREPAETGAATYYFWGINSNDPDFGGMSSPTGTFSYDSAKGYYYYDINNFSQGDYCFVISAVGVSGAAAVKSPVTSTVGSPGNYYLSNGMYHGYNCMHIWNQNKDKVRVYFTSQTSGIYCVKQGSSVTPTTPQPTSVTPTSGTTDEYVYCNNEAGWDAVYAYLWNNDSDKNATWPGERMTNIGGNIWRYHVTKAYAKIIFNIGSDQTQTDDLDYPDNGYIYNNKTGAWSKYSTTPTTQPPTSQQPTSQQPTSQQPTTPPSGSNFIYLENEANWSSVYVYLWNGDGTDCNQKWPGEKMTNIGGKIWRYQVKKKYANIIFNIGSEQTKTNDMQYPGDGYIYNNQTGKWEIYDTSPIQVISYTTDLASPRYNGVTITLSSSATGNGKMYYKYSVKNSSGKTTVLADFSTKNFVAWTPTAVGSYTLIFDFKDAAGNTNQRTLSYSISDGATSTKPFIKSMTPGSTQILRNKQCSISVNAGGGITGTNLLFYKCTIKNPSGSIVNVPYYSLNKGFNFTPTALGKYTVTIDVQGSDNETDERTYTLTSVDKITDDTTTPPEPTAPTISGDPSTFTMKGDADMDGKVSVLDATFIQRYLAEIITANQLNLKNANTDGDNKVSIVDATFIQRYIADLIPQSQW